MKKMKKIIAMLLALIMVLGLSACGTKDKSNGEPATNGGTSTPGTDGKDEGKNEVTDVTLKVWAPQEEQDILKTMVDNFKGLHPEYNLTVEFGVVSEADAANELKKDAAAGADVFAFASDQTAALVEAGLLYRVTKNKDAVVAANSTASISAATVGGELYGYPFTPNSWFMYYDTSKFTEEEVKSLDTMMAKDLGDGVKNFALDLDNGWYLSSFFFANGGTLFGADGTDATKCSFNDANGLAIANYLIDLNANSKFMVEGDQKYIAEFKNGTLGAACSGTWDAAAVKEALGDNYGAIKLPTINVNGTDYQLSNFADFKLMGVNSQTKNPVVAMELAEYLAGEESQKLRFEARSIAPTNVNLANDPAILANEAVAALSHQTQFSTLQATISQMGNYWTAAESFGVGIINGTVTKDNAQDSLNILVEQILKSID